MAAAEVEAEVAEGDDESVPGEVAVEEAEDPVVHRWATQHHFTVWCSHSRIPGPAEVEVPGKTRVCLVSFGVMTAVQTARTFRQAHSAGRRALFSPDAIALGVQAVGRSLGINFPPVQHVFDARDFRPARGAPWPATQPMSRGHSGWHSSHVQSMLLDYPAALEAFCQSLPPLWADLRSGGPVTIVAYCLAGEMRSVCMTRILAYMLSGFPCRDSMDLQVYHLSALTGRWQTSGHVRCADADTHAASESSRGMCSECRADLGDSLTLLLCRQLGFPTLGS